MFYEIKDSSIILFSRKQVNKNVLNSVGYGVFLCGRLEGEKENYEKKDTISIHNVHISNKKLSHGSFMIRKILIGELSFVL